MFIINENDLDKRVLKTRKAIRTAFMHLMQQKPFEQITVLDMADEAVINRATFYAHFDDKYDLLNYTLRYMFNEHLTGVMRDADRLTYDNLRCLSLATLTFLQTFIGHCAPSDRNKSLPFESLIQSFLFDVLVRWLDEHDSLPTDTSTDLVATATSSAMLGATLYYARGKSDLEQDVYIDQLMTVLMDGVRTMM